MSDFSLPTQFDRMIHNPGRLAILSVLAGCEKADFTYLEKTTELNKGTLSKHLVALEDAGYIEIIELSEYPEKDVDEAIMFCPEDCISWNEE